MKTFEDKIKEITELAINTDRMKTLAKIAELVSKHPYDAGYLEAITDVINIIEL